LTGRFVTVYTVTEIPGAVEGSQERAVNPLRQWVVDQYTQVTGRHDDPALYAGPAGDPGLVGPGSVSWEIHGDPAAVFIGGVAAIIMEILHPSVMAGVQDLSAYRRQPFRRAETTYGYVVVTTFASTEAAEGEIDRVRRMHARVHGTRPDGVPYRALDPALIGWVHTCIPWAVMRAFERYNRPLTTSERDRYLAEQAVIGRKGGAGDIPVTTAALDDYVEAMRPHLAVNDQTREFFEFLLTAPFGPPLPSPVARPARAYQLHAAMSVMPRWARRLTGFEHSRLAQRLFFDSQLQVASRSLRPVFGVPPYRAMAEARAAGAPAPLLEAVPA
jgi:uncharacterized protein (DUF2236 family)